jgi:hypothetical protein
VEHSWEERKERRRLCHTNLRRKEFWTTCCGYTHSLPPETKASIWNLIAQWDIFKKKFNKFNTGSLGVYLPKCSAQGNPRTD